MTYSTPSEIQSYLSTIRPGDYHLAYYAETNSFYIRRCDNITPLTISGTNHGSLSIFSYSHNTRTQAFNCSANLIISDITSLEQAQQLHPEAFV